MTRKKKERSKKEQRGLGGGRVGVSVAVGEETSVRKRDRAAEVVSRRRGVTRWGDSARTRESRFPSERASTGRRAARHARGRKDHGRRTLAVVEAPAVMAVESEAAAAPSLRYRGRRRGREVRGWTGLGRPGPGRDLGNGARRGVKNPRENAILSARCKIADVLRASMGTRFGTSPPWSTRTEASRTGTGSIDAPALLQHGFLALVLADLDHALLALAASLIGVDGFLEAFLARLRARRGAKHGGEVTSRGRRTRREERRAVPIVAPRVGFCGAAPEGCKEGSTRGPESASGERAELAARDAYGEAVWHSRWLSALVGQSENSGQHAPH